MHMILQSVSWRVRSKSLTTGMGHYLGRFIKFVSGSSTLVDTLHKVLGIPTDQALRDEEDALLGDPKLQPAAIRQVRHAPGRGLEGKNLAASRTHACTSPWNAPLSLPPPPSMRRCWRRSL